MVVVISRGSMVSDFGGSGLGGLARAFRLKYIVDVRARAHHELGNVQIVGSKTEH